MSTVVEIRKSEPNAARRRIPFVVRNGVNIATDPDVFYLESIPSQATGLTFSGADLKVAKPDGTVTNFAGTVTELAGGVYNYVPTVGELDQVGALTIIVNKTGFGGAATAAVTPGYDVLGYRKLWVAPCRPAYLQVGNIKITARSTLGSAVTYRQRTNGASQALSCTVSSAAITVTLATNGAGTVTSSEADVVDIINNTNSSAGPAAPAASIVEAELTASSVTAAQYNGGVAASLANDVASTGSDSNSGLSWDQAKATIKGAIAAYTYGDHIVLPPGLYQWTATSGVGGNSMVTPDGSIIEGMGERSTIRIEGNTLSFNTVIIPGKDSVIRNLTIDARQALTSAIYTGTEWRPPVSAYFEDLTIWGRGYGIWAGINSVDATKLAIQKQTWTARRCRVHAGVSAFAAEGNQYVQHRLHAIDCYLEANDWRGGGTATNDSGAVAYSVLSVWSTVDLVNCVCYAIHHHLNRSSGCLQAGAPISAVRPGKINMYGGTMHAEHSQAWATPKAITNVTAASPPVVTCAAHGLPNGSLVRVRGVTGTGAITAVNREAKVANVTTNTFELQDQVSGANLSTTGGTYSHGGTVESGLSWEGAAIYDGSVIRLEGVAGAHSWGLIQEHGGQIVSTLLNVEEKLAILQGGANGFVVYAHSESRDIPTYSVTHGWHVRGPKGTLAAAALEATKGDAIYLATPTKPMTITSTFALPPGVRLHGHGPDLSVIEYDGAGGSASTYAMTLLDASLVEDLTIKESTACAGGGGISGIATRGAITAVLDHVKVNVSKNGIVFDNAAGGTANVENCRIVAGLTGMVVSQAYTIHEVGEHPTLVADVGIAASNGAKVRSDANYVTVTKDITADGAATVVWAHGPGVDVTKFTTTSSGSIKTEADTLLDAANGVETAWTLRKVLRVMFAALAGRISGAGTGTVTIKSAADENTTRITATTDDSGNRTTVTPSGD